MRPDNANKDRQAIDLLFAEKCSCVVRNGDTIRIFRERGVRDLWRLLHEEPELLDGAFVADKVVGKGAAAPHIINRAGDGICPVERLCAGARSAAECLPLIEGFLTAGKGAP